MEENPIHDNMDGYVKKSFEDYEENPSDDMWLRIAQELPEAAEKRRPIVLFWRNGGFLRWAAAAVFVLLLGRWGYLEFGQKNHTPSATELVARPEATQVPMNNSASADPKEPAIEQPAAVNGQTNEPVQKTGSPEKINAYTEQRTQPNPINLNPKKGEGTHKSHSQEAERLGNPTTPSGDPLQPTKGHDPAQNNATDIAQHTSSNNNIEKLQIIDIQKIEQRKINISHQSKHQFLHADPTFQSVKSGPDWYMGLAIGPQFSLGERVQTVQQKNGRYRFSNQAERTTVTHQAGVQIGHSFGRHFALESGLNYQNTKRYAIHRPQIEYRESRLVPGSGGTESRSFDYDLNTYGGSAAVSLNMEVRGNQIPAATERVKMSIQTREQLKLLQMPLLAVFRAGQARLQVTLKAGLCASYLLDNQLDIESFGLENPRLRPRTNGRAFTVTYDRPSDFVFGYIAAAGIEYSLNDRLRLQFLPMFQGEFARKDANGGTLPTQNSLGLTAGVNWWF